MAVFKPPTTNKPKYTRPNHGVGPAWASRAASYSALKITNFPANPASGGNPSKLKRNTPKAVTSPGSEWIRPRYLDNSSEPVLLRRNATTAKAPRFVNKYVAR